jgi:ATP-dependent protease ClpP protease subunit
VLGGVYGQSIDLRKALTEAKRVAESLRDLAEENIRQERARAEKSEDASGPSRY